MLIPRKSVSDVSPNGGWAAKSAMPWQVLAAVLRKIHSINRGAGRSVEADSQRISTGLTCLAGTAPLCQHCGLTPLI